MQLRIMAMAVLASFLATALTTAQENPSFGKPVKVEADGVAIDAGKNNGYSGPLFHDVDADGLPDLLVTSIRGNIRYFKNYGTRRVPAFKEQKPLQAEGKPLRIRNW